MNFFLNPCMGNRLHMITTNSSQINIIRSHSSIKIDFMPSRRRGGGPRFMSEKVGLLGGVVPSLMVEEECFLNLMSKEWGGGGKGVG